MLIYWCFFRLCRILCDYIFARYIENSEIEFCFCKSAIKMLLNKNGGLKSFCKSSIKIWLSKIGGLKCFCISALEMGIKRKQSIVLCYVMWNLFTVGSLQFSNDSTIASLETNQNRPVRINCISKRLR